MATTDAPARVRLWLQLQDEVADLEPGEQPRIVVELTNVVLSAGTAAALLRQLAEELEPTKPAMRTVPAELEPAAGELGPAPATRDPLGMGPDSPSQRVLRMGGPSAADTDAQDSRPRATPFEPHREPR